MSPSSRYATLAKRCSWFTTGASACCIFFAGPLNLFLFLFISHRWFSGVVGTVAVAVGIFGLFVGWRVRARLRGARPLKIQVLEAILTAVVGAILYDHSPEFRELVHRQAAADQAEREAIRRVRK